MIETKPRTFAELVDFNPSKLGASADETHGTTIIALRFNGGALMIADRRATAGNYIMYEQAEKVFALDDSTLIAISGSFARSLEVCRFLRHSMKYYRRMVLQELSLEGKLHEISRSLANNAPMAMQGIGVFLPIVAAFDKETKQFSVYFFDGAGASFANGAYACAGSGSERIRGIFEYIARVKGHWETRPMEDVLKDGLEMLSIAAELDSATGGFQKELPVVKVLTESGIESVSEEQLRQILGK